jgi:hypothetical protein
MAHQLSSLSRPPREVVRRRGLPLPLQGVVFLLLPHVWILPYLLWVLINTWSLAHHGHIGKVTVTHHEYVRASRGPRCRISYVYDDSVGHHADSHVFPASAFLQYPPGATIPMRWYRTFGHTTVEFGPPASTPVIAFLTFGVILLFGLLIFSFHECLLLPLSYRRLLRDGDVVVGQIAGKKTHRAQGQYGSVSYELSYAYWSADGADQVQTMRVGKTDYDLPSKGDEVLVFYDPQRPRRSVLYPYCDYALFEWRANEMHQTCTQCANG